MVWPAVPNALLAPKNHIFKFPDSLVTRVPLIPELRDDEQAVAAVADAASQRQPAPECSTLPIASLLGCRSLSCELCLERPTADPETWYHRAECIEPASGTKGEAVGGLDGNRTLNEAAADLFLKYEPSPDPAKTPCACQYQVREPPFTPHPAAVLNVCNV